MKVLLELAILRNGERPHDSDALRAPALQFLNRLGHAMVLAPVHVDIARELFGKRKVVVPLHVHGHLLAGLEYRVSLDYTWPSRHPLRHVASAMVSRQQQVVDAGLCHHLFEQFITARVLGIREARIFLFHDGFQPGIQFQFDHVSSCGDDVLWAAAERCHKPPIQMYLIVRKSSIPYFEPSRPMPDCLMPPKGATSVEKRPLLMLTMPCSSASATRHARPMSRL